MFGPEQKNSFGERMENLMTQTLGFQNLETAKVVLYIENDGKETLDYFLMLATINIGGTLVLRPKVDLILDLVDYFQHFDLTELADDVLPGREKDWLGKVNWEEVANHLLVSAEEYVVFFREEQETEAWNNFL